ncbi:MAG: hypothetical protein O2809_00705 [Proteobacteria bacterium]|nr:hypothetical protein [Pseudomonadota bacterium]
MANAFDIPVLGSGHMYASLLQNIATVMMHSPVYDVFICTMLFLGFYSFMFAAAKHGGVSVQSIMQKFIGCVILIYIMTQVSVSVLIVDEFDSTQTKAVPDVPLILAFPEWFMHKIGFYGAEIVGNLSAKAGFMPNELTPTSGIPLSIAPAMIADASQYQIADPIFKASLSRYMLDCILPNKNFNVGSLYTSKTLWNDIKDMQPNKAISTVWFGDNSSPNTTGEVLSCGDAQKKIAPVMAQLSNKVTDDFLKQSALKIEPKIFQSVLTYYGGSGATGSDMILQSAMMGMLNTTIPESMIASSKSQVLYDQLASQRAARQAFSSWSIEASAFSSTFAYLLVVIDVLGIVLGIIVFPFLFVPFFFSLVRNYLMLLAFIPLATIGLAIAAVIGTYASKGSLSGLSSGLTMSNHLAITQAAIKAYQSLYIYQYMSVTVAAGLAFGMTFIGSRIMSGGNAMEYAKQNATQAAQSSYTGADTQSMSLQTMNKKNISTDTVAGFTPFRQNNIGGNPFIDFNQGGVQTDVDGSAVRNQQMTSTTTTHSENSGVNNTLNNDTSHSDKFSTGQTISQSLASNEAIKTTLSGSGLKGVALAGGYDAWSAMTDDMPDMVPSMVKQEMGSQIKSGVNDTLQADHFSVMAQQAQASGDTVLADKYTQEAQSFQDSAKDNFAAAVKTGQEAKENNSELSGWDVVKEVAMGATTLVAGAALDAAGVVGEVGTGGLATPLVAGAEVAGTSMIMSGAGKVMQYGGRLVGEANGLIGEVGEMIGIKGASKSAAEGAESAIAKETYSFDHASEQWVKDSQRVSDLKNETVAHGERFDPKQYKEELAAAQKGEVASIPRPKAERATEQEALDSLKERGQGLYRNGDQPQTPEAKAARMKKLKFDNEANYEKGYDNKVIRSEQERLTKSRQAELDKQYEKETGIKVGNSAEAKAGSEAEKGRWQRFKESGAGKAGGALMKEFSDGYREMWTGDTKSDLSVKNQQQHNVSDDRSRRYGVGYNQGTSDTSTTTVTTTSTVQLPTYPEQAQTALQRAQAHLAEYKANQQGVTDDMNLQRDTADYGKHQQSFDGNSDKVKEKLNNDAHSAWHVGKVKTVD